jgi:hypothetical protein
MVIIVVRMVVVVAVDDLHSSPGFYGILVVAVGPESTLDCRCRSRDPTSVSLLPRRR